jgi:membrane protease YdiL (CAAX protease family)
MTGPAVRFAAAACGIVLAVYLAYESAVSLKKYRRLQQQIADRDPEARGRFYRDILRFEFVSALLAIAALRFDWSRLTPSHLEIGDTAFGEWWSSAWQHADRGFLAGLAAGGVVALLGLAINRRRERRLGRSAPPVPPRWKKLMPDFGALIPVTSRERALFVLVALSAGVCEEIVYRGWLLDALHHVVGLSGGALVVVAAVGFGLGHYYQGLVGMLVTGVLGLVFCGLYVASGTLLIPIVLHALIDLRVALVPPPAAPISPSSR